MRKLLLFVFLIPIVSSGQSKLKGVVRDAVTREVMPGVNVSIENENHRTVTDANGQFEIEARASSASVTFSFIGYNTVTRTIDASENQSIDLSYDDELLKTTFRFVKANLEVGYFGDKDYAPYGAILNFALQSVGRATIGLTSNFRYWKEEKNSGLEFSIGKDLQIPYIPNILVTYKSLNYESANLELKQLRGLVSYKLPRFFAIDLGGAYNDFLKSNEQEFVESDKHFTGSIGLTKIFSHFSILKNLGVYSGVNYNPNWKSFQVGAYKEFYIKKLTSFVLMAQYYNYESFDQVLFSVRFNLFDSRYYCCHSWAVYSHNINPLK